MQRALFCTGFCCSYFFEAYYEPDIFWLVFTGRRRDVVEGGNERGTVIDREEVTTPTFLACSWGESLGRLPSDHLWFVKKSGFVGEGNKDLSLPLCSHSCWYYHYHYHHFVKGSKKAMTIHRRKTLMASKGLEKLYRTKSDVVFHVTSNQQSDSAHPFMTTTTTTTLCPPLPIHHDDGSSDNSNDCHLPWLSS